MSPVMPQEQCMRPWSFPKRKVLLGDSSDKIDIRITDLSKKRYASTHYTSPNEAQMALGTKPAEETQIRIVSIFSNRTIMPLNITSNLLEYLFTHYDISPEFADVIASFGQEPDIAEASSNNATILTDDLGCSVLSYQIRYVERNGRGSQGSWSRRHTGIFHRYSTISGPDVMIVLHPVCNPAFQDSITLLQNDHVRREDICKDPMKLHETLFACYMDNWRWYMRLLGERFDRESNLAMVMKSDHAEPNSSFVRVQELRHTNDLLFFARACCAGNLDLLDRMSQLVSATGSVVVLDVFRAKLKGYIDSADVLKGQVQNLIDFVGYTLTLHNQLESARVEKELRDLTESLNKLTQDTVDDSATVKIITFLSAVYLPGSFVATLLGMNVFAFDEGTKRLRISPDFWIFVAVWLPLTLITGGIYVFTKSRSKREAMARKVCSHKRYY